ncbi:MAG: acylphosphatase [Candidatus Nealsonbacteria bacterium]|nr:MAG: acylphosphatase [Candidatus Nealsonbacteria bacterium]
MEEKIRAHMIVSGRVQGVFFRQNTIRKAKELDVFGWVRNLFDGRVEAVFEGRKKKVEKIINWVKKGPVSAEVDNCEVKWQKYKGEFKGFDIRF